MDAVAAHEQVVLASVFGGGDRMSSVWLDERVFPFYISAASLSILVLQFVWSSKTFKRFRCSQITDDGAYKQSHGFLGRAGGPVIFAFKSLRLGVLLAFLALTIYTTVRHRRGWTDIAILTATAYAVVLATFNVLSSARKALVFSAHLSSISFAILAVYAYRDVWPLMTFTLQPKDLAEGDILWARLALIAFVGALEPVFEPYPYIPYDYAHPYEHVSGEQTASIASFITYTWIEPTIWRAYKVPHLPVNELPALCDYDAIKNLIQESYPKLDPFSGAPKKGHVVIGIIKVLRKPLTIQTTLLLIHGIVSLAVPIGTNRLLAYLETGGEGAVIRPWVWILWIGGGPALRFIIWQFYLFLSQGSLVRVQAIITSLIFDHALRIRVKAETADEPARDAPGAPGAATNDAAGDDADSDDADTVHSHAATESTATAAAPAAEQTKSADGTQGAEGPGKPASRTANLTGKLNNLVTSDLENIVGGRDFLFVVLSSPLQFALAMIFLYGVLGWSSFVGLAVMIILLPVPTWVAARMDGVQTKKMEATDARVAEVTETMSMLRMIKLFGWESRVRQKIAEKREAELGWVWKSKVLGLTNNVVNHSIPLIHMIVTFAVYTAVMKQKLSASIVFSAVSAFTGMRNQLFTIMFKVPELINANVSLRRVAEFLRDTEVLDNFTETTIDTVQVAAAEAHRNDIGFGRAEFSWSREDHDGSQTPSTRRTFRLRIEGEVAFKQGGFNLIVGPTGSGKTSVLMALLGEMHYIPLAPDSWANLPRHGGVAYAAQESWVQNETIKENILFGAPYDEERYKQVIYQCGLTRDLSLFDAGDETEVGEKGLTLSGGQKARVTLARAVYSAAQTLLLDDVLAALDVHTARWIVNKCFKGNLLQGRTVILITHNIAMAGPLADFVISVRDGRIVSQGSVRDVLTQDKILAEEVKHEEEALELDENEEAVDPDSVDPAEAVAAVKAKDGKLVVAEEVAVGRVSQRAFMLLVAALGGTWPILFWAQYILAAASSDFLMSVEIWWLGYWAQQYAFREPSQVNIAYYLGIYGVIIFLVDFTYSCGQILYTFGGLRASRIIHDKLVHSLLGSTFRWLDITPTSRVIARCTQDIRAADEPVPNFLSYVLDATITLLVKLGIVLIFAPAFIVPAIVITILGAFLGNVYTKAQLSMKREAGNAKAPVLATFGGAMAGLTSVRAYNAQEAFRKQIQQRIDFYVRISRAQYNANRWMSTRLDVLGQIFTMSLAFYLVYGGYTDNPTSIGFILTVAVDFSSSILWWVQMYNQLEVTANSLERIQQYLDIEQEPEPQSGGQPPAYWPSSGDLRVEDLSARYSLDGPKVLQNVSFHVKPGQRVGVVGRTGSGKSTLTLALLRCIYTEGTVIYDGIRTDTINLDALRSNITIIPQVPELLSGTLRHNLDLFNQYDDATLNDALRAAGLFSLQSASDENRITLDSEIASGGGNLSVGQRQIIALARAIVRQSKLLILDEATSAIDYETDAVIQSSLRTELKSDVTVITVAHRLQTIMDYDNIMVLDAGRLVEYDSPKALLRREGSLLRALVEESADKDALYAMAGSEA